MSVKPAIFQSGGLASQHYLPGAYSRLNFIRGSGGLVSINNAVIMGDSRGGEPNKLLWFGNAAEAEEELFSGSLLDAVRHAFSPGGGLVPQVIAAWRVNPGTQSIHNYQSSSNTMIVATSRQYGLFTNQIKTKLEDGALVGKKVTIQYKDNDAEVWDNVEKESFEIQYTGAGSACTMDIGLSSLATTVTGGPGGEELSIDFSTIQTIEDLVNYINDQSAYTCTLITTGGLGSDPTTELDSVTAQDILSAPYTAHSDVQAIIDILNESAWVTAEFYSAATSRDIPDNETSFVYFTGAADGAYTSSEWTTSLTLLEVEDIQFIGCSSEDSSIHSLIKSHCESMNSVTGKAERQFIVGGAAGETIAQMETRAANLNSDAGMIAYPGFSHYDFNDYSKTKTWSPAYYAAKLIGMVVTLAIQEPITNKDVDVLNWEKQLTISEVEQLIKAGVCTGYTTRGGRIVNARGINTYQGSILQQNEFSIMRIALYVSRDLRTSVENAFIGRAMSNVLLGKVDAIVIGKLSLYADLGLFTGSPQYWGYQKTVVGDQIKIEYNCYLTPPTNFIFITSHMHLYASTNG